MESHVSPQIDTLIGKGLSSFVPVIYLSFLVVIKYQNGASFLQTKVVSSTKQGNSIRFKNPNLLSRAYTDHYAHVKYETDLTFFRLLNFKEESYIFAYLKLVYQQGFIYNVLHTRVLKELES